MKGWNFSWNKMTSIIFLIKNIKYMVYFLPYLSTSRYIESDIINEKIIFESINVQQRVVKKWWEVINKGPIRQTNVLKIAKIAVFGKNIKNYHHNLAISVQTLSSLFITIIYWASLLHLKSFIFKLMVTFRLFSSACSCAQTLSFSAGIS